MKVILASIVWWGAGCGGDSPKLSAPTAADPFASVTGPTVIVTRGEVRVLGKSLGITPDQLLADRGPVVSALRAGNVAGAELVVAYTPDASAAVVLAAWRGTHEAGFTRVDLDSVVDGKAQLVCGRQSFAPAPADVDKVHLSIRVDPEQRWVGISRVNEFQAEQAPYADYAGHLHEHKQSAFFADRQDVEVAAPPETTGEQLTGAITPVCQEFSDVLPLTVAELSANPNVTGDASASGFDDTNVYGGLLGSGSASGAVPTLTLGEPAITGAIDKTAVVAALAKNQPKLQYCYEKQLLVNPELAGSIAAKLTIKKDGTAPDASATGVDPQVSGCVAEVLQGVEFPKPRGGTAKVSVTLEARTAAARH